jgi:hypothetical protein
MTRTTVGKNAGETKPKKAKKETEKRDDNMHAIEVEYIQNIEFGLQLSANFDFSSPRTAFR